MSIVFAHPFPFGFVNFAGLWVAFSVLLSRIGGWATLARQYGCSGEFAGDRWRFQSGQMRYLVGYNNCLTVGANREGLYISLVVPFLLGHPALFIPWREISVSRKKVLWFKRVQLGLGCELPIPFQISERRADKLKQSAGKILARGIPGVRSPGLLMRGNRSYFAGSSPLRSMISRRLLSARACAPCRMEFKAARALPAGVLGT